VTTWRGPSLRRSVTPRSWQPRYGFHWDSRSWSVVWRMFHHRSDRPHQAETNLGSQGKSRRRSTRSSTSSWRFDSAS